MVGTFSITWRESIEAALIVGIFLTYLSKIGQSKNYKYVYWGTGWVISASLILPISPPPLASSFKMFSLHNYTFRRASVNLKQLSKS